MLRTLRRIGFVPRSRALGLARLAGSFTVRPGVGVHADRPPAVARLEPRGSSAAEAGDQTETSPRTVRTRSLVGRTAPIEYPGMQHTLERTAIRVNAAPWLY
jgi:hypothetical protein